MIEQPDQRDAFEQLAEMRTVMDQAALEASNLLDALSAATTVNVALASILADVQGKIIGGSTKAEVLEAISNRMLALVPAIDVLANLTETSMEPKLIELLEEARAGTEPAKA